MHLDSTVRPYHGQLPDGISLCLTAYVRERSLRVPKFVLHPAGSGVELLEYGFELLVLEEGLDDTLQDDNAQPLVEHRPLEHVKYHQESGPGRL